MLTNVDKIGNICYDLVTTKYKSDDEDGAGKCVSQRAGGGGSPANCRRCPYPFRAEIPKANASRGFRDGCVKA